MRATPRRGRARAPQPGATSGWDARRFAGRRAMPEEDDDEEEEGEVEEEEEEEEEGED